MNCALFVLIGNLRASLQFSHSRVDDMWPHCERIEVEMRDAKSGCRRQANGGAYANNEDFRASMRLDGRHHQSASAAGTRIAIETHVDPIAHLKGNIMVAKKWMAVCSLLLTTQGLAGLANASHGIVAEPAGLLEAQADAALAEIDVVFRHSRLLRAMSGEVYGVMDAASDVRQLARIDAPVGRLRGKVIVAEARLRTLEHLIDAAERLSRHGVDPPLCGCADRIRQQLCEMRATIDCLKDRLDRIQNRRHVAHRPDFNRPYDLRDGYCLPVGRRPHSASLDHGGQGFAIQTGSFRLVLGR